MNQRMFMRAAFSRFLADSSKRPFSFAFNSKLVCVFLDALALSGSNLYIGGVFNSYRGNTYAYRLAKVDATTGALDTTNFNTTSAGPAGNVYVLALSGSSLYVGGAFTSYRSNMGSGYIVPVSTTTGIEQ